MSSFFSERSTLDEIEQTNEILNEKEKESEKKLVYLSIADILKQVISEQKQVIQKKRKSHFNAVSAPSISIEDYLTRICTYSNPEVPTMICSLIYIDRLCSNGTIYLSKYNIHRILFTSILLALKYNEDEMYTLDYYASIAGVSKKELSKLEAEFLSIINFNLCVNGDEYTKYYNYLTSK